MVAQSHLIQESLFMAKQEEKSSKKTKRPTAIKRDIQAKKRNIKNRVHRARVKTAVRSYQETLTKGDKEAYPKMLSEIYSLVDKGVKMGVFKKNKSSRIKSRMASRIQK